MKGVTSNSAANKRLRITKYFNLCKRKSFVICFDKLPPSANRFVDSSSEESILMIFKISDFLQGQKDSEYSCGNLKRDYGESCDNYFCFAF